MSASGLSGWTVRSCAAVVGVAAFPALLIGCLQEEQGGADVGSGIESSEAGGSGGSHAGGPGSGGEGGSSASGGTGVSSSGESGGTAGAGSATGSGGPGGGSTAGGAAGQAGADAQSGGAAGEAAGSQAGAGGDSGDGDIIGDLCSGATDGAHCGATLSVFADPSARYLCGAGSTFGLTSCQFGCDTNTNQCRDQGGGSTGGGREGQAKPDGGPSDVPR